MSTPDPRTSVAIRRLAEQLDALKRGQAAQNAPQLAASSIEDGAVEQYDADGQLVAVFGRQADGTSGAVVVAGPPPPAPAGLTAAGSQLAATATWDGTWVESLTAPMDFARVEVHTTTGSVVLPDTMPSSSTRVGSIESAAGGSLTFSAAPGEVWVWLVARALSGKVSSPAGPVKVTVTAAVDPTVFDQLATDLTSARTRLSQAETDLAAMNKDLYETGGTVDQIKTTLTGGLTDATSTASKAAQDAQEAWNTADVAQATASSKNQITWSTADAPALAAGTRSGDIWNRYVLASNRLTIVASWTSDGTRWSPSAISETYLPQISIGTGTYGELDGLRLKAASVQANTILVPGSVGTTVIADGAITSPKLVVQEVSAAIAQVIQLDVSRLTVTESSSFAAAVVDKLWANVFAANKVTASQIDAASVASAVGEFVKVKAENIAAGMITARVGIGTDGEIFAGDPAGARASLTNAGIRIYALGEGGEVYQSSSLGTGTNSLEIIPGPGVAPTASITPDGDLSAQSGTFQRDVVVAGRPLLGSRLDAAVTDPAWLDDFPRGLVSYISFVEQVRSASVAAAADVILGVTEVTLVPGRSYAFTMHWRATSTVNGDRGRTSVSFRRTVTTDGTAPPEPVLADPFLVEQAYAIPLPGTNSSKVNILGSTMRVVFPAPVDAANPGQPVRMSLALGIAQNNATLTPSVDRSPHAWHLAVEDLGPTPWITLGTAPGGVGQATYTSTWRSDGPESFSTYDTATGSKMSGDNSGSILRQNRRTRHGAFIFNRAAIAGERDKTLDQALANNAVINKAEIYLYALGWPDNSNKGGEFKLRPLQMRDIPDTDKAPSVNTPTAVKTYTGAGQGQWITIPTSWISLNSRGVRLGPQDWEGVTGHGYAAGSTHQNAGYRPQLRLTYTR